MSGVKSLCPVIAADQLLHWHSAEHPDTKFAEQHLPATGEAHDQVLGGGNFRQGGAPPEGRAQEAGLCYQLQLPRDRKCSRHEGF